MELSSVRAPASTHSGADRTSRSASCVRLPVVARPDYYGNPAGISEEIEIVKAVYEAFAARDAERLVGLLSEDCVLQFEGTAKLVGRSGPYVGHAGLQDYLQDVDQVWEQLVLHADDFP